MTYTTSLSKLKKFFWTALAFNLPQFLGIIFSITDIWKRGRLHAAAPAAFYVVVLSIDLLVPAIVIYNALVVLRNYFPVQRISQGFRIWITSICILQLLSSIIFAISGLNALIIELPKLSGKMTKASSFAATMIATSIFVANLSNLVAAIVLLRTIRKIRRNYRDSPWESFESAA